MKVGFAEGRAARAARILDARAGRHQGVPERRAAHERDARDLVMVYLNGNFVKPDEAVVPVTDRGFLFADGVYEVMRVYGGRPVLFTEHLERMRRGLAELRIAWAGVDGLAGIAGRLIAENGLERADSTVYVQVTRGAPPRRSHAFPPDTPPTVYVAAQEHPRHPAGLYDRGVAALLVEDMRWKRRDIKSIALLPNVLAQQKAHEAGAFEALLVENGNVLEGSHSNLFAVDGDTVFTHPLSAEILPGITRGVVLELASELGIPVREEPLARARLADFSELFLTGTTTEILPVTRIDGRPVGSGAPGPVARALQDAYLRRVAPGHAGAARTARV
jgi:D-alanine transaminase